MGIEVLVTTIVTTFLRPYIEKGAQKFADDITDKVSQSAADHVTGVAEKLWTRIKGIFSSPSDQKVVELFEEDPEGMQSKMEKSLREKLEADNTLAQELEALVQKPSPDGAGTGAQIIGATYAGIVDLRGATISGSNATITGVNVGGSVPPQNPSPTAGSPRPPANPPVTSQ